MKKRLMVFVIMAVLVLFAVSASALPVACPYCGHQVNTYQDEYTHYETYNVPCSNSELYGTDQVTVTYTVFKTFCSYCNTCRYEKWWEDGRTTTCHGWSNPSNNAGVVIDTIKK